MGKHQTSVEWLFREIWDTPKDKLKWYAILEEALMKHQEEIVSAVESVNINEKGEFLTGNEYYNKEYKQ